MTFRAAARRDVMWSRPAIGRPNRFRFVQPKGTAPYVSGGEGSTDVRGKWHNTEGCLEWAIHGTLENRLKKTDTQILTSTGREK